MDWSSTLLMDTGAGRRQVRSPYSTDAIGATLRDGYPIGRRLPDDMRGLLGRLDAVADLRPLSDRG